MYGYRRSNSANQNGTINGTTNGTPTAVDIPPYGHSLFWTVWKNDSTPVALKSFYMMMTPLGLSALLFFPNIMMQLFGLNGNWDQEQGVFTYMELLTKTLGLPVTLVHALFFITVTLCLLLVATDAILVGKHRDNDLLYPKSWNTDNMQCYTQMFTEPTRVGRLIRRPGNTLSNASYLFASLCILASVAVQQEEPDGGSPFLMGDAVFGVMLLLLATSSTLWHGTNAPWTQYPDLWSMDCCIAYLIIRYACFGLLCILQNVLDADKAKRIAGWMCVSLFSLLVYSLGKLQLELYTSGWLHGPCPYSVRARLSGTSNIFGRGHVDIGMGVVCGYMALPAGFTALPTLIHLFLVNNLGSVHSANLAFRTLVVGWTYRMWERWTLDGNLLLNGILRIQPTTQIGHCLKTVLAAILSPTAVLHALTGVTLLAGYMHARSVDSLLVAEEEN